MHKAREILFLMKKYELLEAADVLMIEGELIP
jgi:1,4-dihydroxy-2-naphthoyl-CoA synthase